MNTGYPARELYYLSIDTMWGFIGVLLPFLLPLAGTKDEATQGAEALAIADSDR